MLGKRAQTKKVLSGFPGFSLEREEIQLKGPDKFPLSGTLGMDTIQNRQDFPCEARCLWDKRKLFKTCPGNTVDGRNPESPKKPDVEPLLVGIYGESNHSRVS